jgi:hypothetical protein
MMHSKKWQIRLIEALYHIRSRWYERIIPYIGIRLFAKRIIRKGNTNGLYSYTCKGNRRSNEGV